MAGVGLNDPQVRDLLRYQLLDTVVDRFRDIVRELAELPAADTSGHRLVLLARLEECEWQGDTVADALGVGRPDWAGMRDQAVQS